MLYGAFQKTVQTAIVLLIVSVASFGFLKLAPGDPVMAVMDEEFDQETYDRLFHEMGLDRPAVEQFGTWLIDFVTLDWGHSYISRVDIFQLAIVEALPVTLSLAAYSLIFSLAIGIPLGVLGAVRQNSVWDVFGGGILLQSVVEVVRRVRGRCMGVLGRWRFAEIFRESANSTTRKRYRGVLYENHCLYIRSRS